MLISKIFKSTNIKINLQSTLKKDLFEELVNHLTEAESLKDKEAIINKIWERENKLSTGIFPNIAIPHASLKELSCTIGVLGVSKKGIEYDSLDGKPVYLVMMLIGNDNNPAEHLKILKNIAVLLNEPMFFTDIMKCKDAEELNLTIVSYEKKLIINNKI